MRFAWLVLCGAALFARPAYCSALAVTMDDPEHTDSPSMDPEARNAKILAALDAHRAKAALFVCGMRIDDEAGKKLLAEWDKRGHLLANHSYSHLYFPSKKTDLSTYASDFRHGKQLVSSFRSFQKFFRYPFLKEGDTAAKRDGMRQVLADAGYRVGAVTIDASDWYVDARLRRRLKENPKADLAPYREFYLNHIWDRATYYDKLAREVLGREVKHTLLIHHSLLNALFLDNLLKMFEQKGWRIIDATEAFKDPVFDEKPPILPAGESLIWALAKATGRYDKVLRYPGEDGDYEKSAMDKLGL